MGDDEFANRLEELNCDFSIYNWDSASAANEILLGLGYEQEDDTSNFFPKSDQTVFEAAEEISKSGLNVMIIHLGNDIIKYQIYVDNKRFTQR